jgi:hypothetical protein
MEEPYDQGLQKIEILKELIHSYDNEGVKRAIAHWQMDVMQNGPEKEMKLDGEPGSLTMKES